MTGAHSTKLRQTLSPCFGSFRPVRKKIYLTLFTSNTKSTLRKRWSLSTGRMPKGAATKKAALPRALMPGMEPPDFLCYFDLVINLFSVPLLLGPCLGLKRPKPREKRAKGRRPIVLTDLSLCASQILLGCEQMPRTPRTGHARPSPRRSAPKSRFFEQNSHALTPR